jgi:catechol 2,3-dioxygenase-like lactoylglutathione lyase family enzyme
VTGDSFTDATRPRFRVSGPTLDAARPLELAAFYARLLGWEIARQEGPQAGEPPWAGWAMLRAPDGTMKIEVQYEPYYRPPVWPPVEGQQLMMVHLDIGVDDLAAGVAWAVAQGARVADHQPQHDVTVMTDPEGHPFCLFPWA